MPSILAAWLLCNNDSRCGGRVAIAVAICPDVPIDLNDAIELVGWCVPALRLKSIGIPAVAGF